MRVLNSYVKQLRILLPLLLLFLALIFHLLLFLLLLYFLLQAVAHITSCLKLVLQGNRTLGDLYPINSNTESTDRESTT